MITLLLLPGMDGTGLLFQDFIKCLDGTVKVIVIPYPNNEPLDYSQLESIVRKELPGDKPYVLLGESFSGPIAISLAASAPPGLLGIILCCSFAQNPQPLFSRFRPLLRFLPIPKTVGILSPLFFGHFSSAKLRANLQHALDQVSTSALRARLQAVLGVDVSRSLSKIKIPLLYLRGTEDNLIGQNAVNLIIKSAPQAQIVNIQGPHFLLQTVPELAVHPIWSFIKQLEL